MARSPTTIVLHSTVKSDCFNCSPAGQSHLQVPRCAACYKIDTKGGGRKSILVSDTQSKYTYKFIVT